MRFEGFSDLGCRTVRGRDTPAPEVPTPRIGRLRKQWRQELQRLAVFHHPRFVSFIPPPTLATDLCKDRAEELHGKHTLFGRCVGDTIYSAS